MLDEQVENIRLFREHHGGSDERMVLYGTGINAEAVAKQCRDCPIEGIMDVTKTGEVFCGFPVLSPEEIQEKQIKKIVVIARPAVHAIIYKRIKSWCEENQIRVYDVRGNSFAEKFKAEKYDSPYFDRCLEALEREIDAHEIISFDIFDTLLMRRLYEPKDLFSLIEPEVKGWLLFSFSAARQEAEQELLAYCEPNIYQIYELMGRKNQLSEEICHSLLEMELEKEKEVLVVRNKMKECMDYCIARGKKVFLVSDMYLPSEILENFLNRLGITGYQEILVSCECGVSKPKGLFQILKDRAGGQSYLHIGDNQEADGVAAAKYGVDSFLIMSAVSMMEISAYRGALAYLDGIESRVMIGMLASEIFNNPFSLYHSNGRPLITCPRQFGYLLMAPLILSYLVWMIGKLEHKQQAVMLFSARDGWIIRQAYHILTKNWKLSDLPKDIYFMVSRRALVSAEQHFDCQAEDGYQKYLKDLKMDQYNEIYFFDFMSRGTCQSKLETLIGRKLKGLYFQKSISGITEKDTIEVESFFKEKNAQGSALRVFAMCDFLECIMTSYQPSLAEIDSSGEYRYEEERRTDEQIKCLQEIHGGILEYCACFSKVVKRFPAHMPPVEFCDEILKYTGAEFSDVRIPVLREFMLDDWLGGDKNTGKDILM